MPIPKKVKLALQYLHRQDIIQEYNFFHMIPAKVEISDLGMKKNEKRIQLKLDKTRNLIYCWRRKDRIFDLGEIVYKEIIQEAVLGGCEIKYFDKNDTGFYYIRTENIDDKLHNQIIKIIDKSNSYKEIYAKIKELGYKIPDDVIII